MKEFNEHKVEHTYDALSAHYEADVEKSINSFVRTAIDSRLLVVSDHLSAAIRADPGSAAVEHIVKALRQIHRMLA